MMTVSFNYDTFMTAGYGPHSRVHAPVLARRSRAARTQGAHRRDPIGALRQRRHNLLRKRRADAGHLCQLFLGGLLNLRH